MADISTFKEKGGTYVEGIQTAGLRGQEKEKE